MAIKYKWLAGQLRELIQNNIRQGIQQLPTEAALCQKYRVSRQTVRSALALLKEEGLIDKRQGSGSHITGRFSDPQENVVGILVSSSQEYIYPGILNDIHRTLSLNGFTDQVFVTDNRTSTEREILLSILAHPLRGMIVEGCKSALPNPNLDLYHRLMKKGTRILFLYNYYPALPDCLYLKDDNSAGSGLLVRHLAERGHTAIGGIFKADDMQGPERFQGFMEAMQSCHLEVPDERIYWYHSRDLYKLMTRRKAPFLTECIQEALKSCTAVVCYNDYIAYFLLRELARSGYQLPDDMAVAAFDNTYLSDLETLTVTTLSHKPHEMGTRAAQMMIETLKGLPVLPQEVPWTLNLRESTQKSVE